MPVDNSGTYRMTQGGANMHNAAQAQTPATTGQPKQIILTQQPDGSYTCDDGTGNPSTHPSLDDALAYVKTTLGGDQPDQQQPADTGTSDSGNNDDEY